MANILKLAIHGRSTGILGFWFRLFTRVYRLMACSRFILHNTSLLMSFELENSLQSLLPWNYGKVRLYNHLYYEWSGRMEHNVECTALCDLFSRFYNLKQRI